MKIITYRNEPEDISKPIQFDIAFLGYTRFSSRYGLEQFVENNKEQVERFKKSVNDCEVILKDGTKIIAISDNRDRWRGYKFDQLILFDDYRWEIKEKKNDIIRELIATTMYFSNVPKDFQILEYEDIEDIR